MPSARWDLWSGLQGTRPLSGQGPSAQHWKGKGLRPAQLPKLSACPGHLNCRGSLCCDAARRGRVRLLGSPARLLRPLGAHFLCENSGARRAGLITSAGARCGKRAAAAAKLQPCKDRARRSQSRQHVPRAEQRGLSGWSGNGSLTRLSRRELPRHRRCPEAQQLPPEELPRLCGAPRCTESCYINPFVNSAPGRG